MQALKSLEIGTLITTLKIDAKFEVGLTCRLKNDTRKLGNFEPRT